MPIGLTTIDERETRTKGRRVSKIGGYANGAVRGEALSDRSIPRLEADFTLFHARKLRLESGRRFTDTRSLSLLSLVRPNVPPHAPAIVPPARV